MRKLGIALMMIITVGLFGLVFWIYEGTDRQAPQIEIAGDKDNIYRDDITDAEILEGISANDSRDGDVSDTLMIESVYPKSGNEEYIVTIVAKDRSNNVAKAEYVMYKQDGETEIEESSFSDEGEKTEWGMEVYNAVDGDKESAIQNPKTDAEKVSAKEEEKLRGLDKDAPHLYLTTYYVEIKPGDSIRCMDYILDITDNTESQSDLYKKVRIAEYPDGIEEVIYEQPGIYQLTFHVQDVDGKDSNDAVLTIVVE